MKYPEGLQIDKKGFYYLKDDGKYKKPIYFTDYAIRDEFTCKSVFYRIESTNDYIIKSNVISQDRQFRKETLELLRKFMEVSSKISNIDFPIAYYKEGWHANGTIIPYYECASSLKNMMNNYSLENIKSIYNHDENNIKNLFSILIDVLDLIYVLYQHGIFYYDINYGNFLIYQNGVKIIDFEPKRVRLCDDKNTFAYLTINYLSLVRDLLEKYQLSFDELIDLPNYKKTSNYVSDDVVRNYAINIGHDFLDVKKYVKRLEESVISKGV